MIEPINAATGNNYNGGNIVALLIAMEELATTDPRFMTFKQALTIGRVVRKGQKSCARVIKVFERTADDGDSKKQRRKGVAGFCVFHYSQTDDLSATIADAIAEGLTALAA